MRTCSRCGLSEPEVGFRDQPGKQCKACLLKASNAWRDANRERVLALQRKRYAANPQKGRDAIRKYRADNPEKVKAARFIAWWKNPEASRKYLRDWQAKNRKKVSAYHLKWARANPKKANATVARWHKRHPEESAQMGAARRARKKGAEGSHSLLEWRTLLRGHGHRCAYCGVVLGKSNRSKDHKIPLVRGGSDRIENILPACRRCNSSKNTKTHDEFLSLPDRPRVPGLR